MVATARGTHDTNVFTFPNLYGNVVQDEGAVLLVTEGYVADFYGSGQFTGIAFGLVIFRQGLKIGLALS